MGFLIDLEGRNALVTGGSSGPGRYFANVLARAGANVAIAARRRESLQKVHDEICNSGSKAIAVPLDVTRPTSIASAVSQVAGELGGVDNSHQ